MFAFLTLNGVRRLRRALLKVRQYFKDSNFYAADVEARGFCDQGFMCEGFSASAATVKVGARCVICVFQWPNKSHGFLALGKRCITYETVHTKGRYHRQAVLSLVVLCSLGYHLRSTKRRQGLCDPAARTCLSILNVLPLATPMCAKLNCTVPIQPDPDLDQAMLINSANLMGGGSEPMSYRGFGRIHLEAGMPLNGDGALALFVEDMAEVESDGYKRIMLNVDADAGLELRATLSWIDPAASSVSAVQLVNDLDLRGEVIVESTAVRQGIICT